MIDCFAAVYRDGTAVSGLGSVPMRIEFATDMEAKAEAGESPYYRYVGIVRQIIDLRQFDLLQNVQYCSPLTGALTAYLDPASGNAVTWQLVDKPETFLDGHLEFKADDVRAVNFS